MDPDLKTMKEQRKKLLDECQAFEEKAKAEKRDDLTEVEAKTVDDNLTAVDTLTAKIDAGNAARGRSDRLQRSVAQMNATEPPIVPLEQPVKPGATERTDERIPAQIRPYRKLVCFGGEDGARRAYRMGQWTLGHLGGNQRAQEWCQDNGIITRRSFGDSNQRAMSTGNNFSAGYLIPEEFSADIIELLETFGVFRREADPEPMVGDTKIIPRRTSGINAFFIGENTKPTESEPTWDQVQLTAKLLATLTRLSIEVSEDSIVNLGEKIAIEVGRAFALKEDRCGFIGTGTSEFGGIVGVTPKLGDGNHAGSIHDALTGNTAFSTLDLVDFEAALGKLPEYAVQGGNAKWFISRIGFYASMSRLMTDAGGNTIDHLAGGAGLQFLGLPVVISQVMNSDTTTQTSTIVCFVGDLRMAASFGDRRQLTLMTSEHRYMDVGQIGIRGTERFDIQIHDLGNATVAGPIVGLKTPGS